MRSWLELMRLSNAPTILTNVLAGISIGLLERLGGAQPDLRTTGLLLGGASAVYAAGMVLNDACDARTDAAERPSRPVPSGRVSRGTAAVVGLLLLAGGTGLLCLASSAVVPWAILLAASVLLYDVVHLQLPGAWLLLGLCRGLVILIAARATSPGAAWPIIGWVGGGLFVYVVMFSIAARDEMRGLRGAARAATFAVPVAVLAPAGLLLFDLPRAEPWSQWAGYGVLALLALPVATVGTLRAAQGKAGIGAAIGGWIGAIALMDAAVCFFADRPWLGLACIGLWGAAGAMRPRIAAT